MTKQDFEHKKDVGMQKLLDQFWAAPSNKFQDQFEEGQADMLLNGISDTARNRMLNAVEFWCDSVLPCGISPFFEHYVIYVEAEETHIPKDSYFDLLAEMISEYMDFEEAKRRIEK